MPAYVYLLPTILAENTLDCLPNYLLSTIRECDVIFAENERTTRRFLKQLDKAIVIDNYEWHTIHNLEQEQLEIFKKAIKAEKKIAIISEAGCPGIADPGQVLIALAHEMTAIVKPLVGPSSILLALMASGLNGQHFSFVGYLPIENSERIKSLAAIETESYKKKSTQIFIETPYRNNQLLQSLIKTLKPATLLCIAVNLTGKDEWVKTKTVKDWSKDLPDINKIPAIFLIQG